MKDTFVLSEKELFQQPVRSQAVDVDAISGEMKRRYFLAGSFALMSMLGKAQVQDSVFRVKQVKKTEIEFLYNHYIQSGNHSAVTGGIGTEQLSVVAPQLSVFTTYPNRSSLYTKFGVDVVTSASTDNIDFVKSSASLVDARTHFDLSYSHPVRSNVSVSFGGGFSIESDYFSLPLSAGISITDKKNLRVFKIDFQSYFDDLRWGRLSSSLSPQKLIYPEELRYKQWFMEYKRHSFNLKFALTQILNRRNRLGIYPEVSYQSGLLSTPFHRVYFDDGSLRVENLPNQRWKLSWGLKLNTFVGGRTILKNAIDLYADSFSLRGLGIENETAIKVTPTWVVAPSIRFYFQQGSIYFSAYQLHPANEEFYTSDYDLSTMTTRKIGLTIRHTLIRDGGRRKNGIEFSYSIYNRTDGLMSHIFSCAFKIR